MNERSGGVGEGEVRGTLGPGVGAQETQLRRRWQTTRTLLYFLFLATLAADFSR